MIYGTASYGTQSYGVVTATGTTVAAPQTSVIGRNRSYKLAGAVDGRTYHALLEQGNLWELRRAQYRDTDPAQLYLGALVDSSNNGNPVSFDDQQPLDVICVVPGVQAELEALFR